MVSSAADLTSRVVRNERVIIVCALALLTALGWAYLLRGMAMQMAPPLGALIAMWWLMMVAMMSPSATPAVLLYARVRQTREGDGAIAQTWVFLMGYLAVWLGFSIGAALFQSQAIHSSMELRSKGAESAVLILAGLYQLSPFKSVCISHCRSPAEFISRHWRPGWKGAVRLGITHGAYCVGCCWMLMALLFVGGVMNLLWVVGLTALVAGEKILPARLMLPKIAGVALISWGLLKAVG